MNLRTDGAYETCQRDAAKRLAIELVVVCTGRKMLADDTRCLGIVVHWETTALRMQLYSSLDQCQSLKDLSQESSRIFVTSQCSVSPYLFPSWKGVLMTTMMASAASGRNWASVTRAPDYDCVCCFVVDVEYAG